MRIMKAITAIFLALLITALCGVTAFADGTVTYSGNSGKFIFAPGSESSPTDLFDSFKGVMPGDTLTQKVTVKNNANNKVKVNIYMRSLGAVYDEEFLSKFKLKVDLASFTVMFDAPPSETAGLTDWVLLGTLYSGGEADLNLNLTVPIELDNTYANRLGILDWEFKVEEMPIESTDPTPETGDTSNIALYIGVTAVFLVLVIVLFVLLKRRKREEQQ